MENGIELLPAFAATAFYLALDFLLLNCNPNVLVLLEIQNFWRQAQLRFWLALVFAAGLLLFVRVAFGGRAGLDALDHAEDEGFAGAVPFESLEFFFRDNLRNLIKITNLVSRDHARDHKKEAFKIEAD